MAAYGYYNQLQINFRKFWFSSDVDSTWVDFINNSMFINQGLSLFLVKGPDGMETISASYLVNLANQLSHIPNESPTRKIAKIFNLQLQQLKTAK